MQGNNSRLPQQLQIKKKKKVIHFYINVFKINIRA